MGKKSAHDHGPVKKDIHPDFTGDKRWAPLTTGFLVTSIIGFFISILYIRTFSLPLSVSFATVFFCMFLASMISMARASPDAQLAARPIK